MSEKKKVIYVKDLVIKADNVHIEPQQRPRSNDPFFGPRRGVLAEESVEDKKDEEEVEAVEDDHGNDDHKDDEEKRPFSWI
ncbi:hypothetical protein [Aquibacillus saliphilus]|uniref:hypothetical protein n=1 Tax=Aquibacillus saliphilus TaxID=1909422 RepID=UPI001CEFBB28|nr:hypothetical protein [Aquibacillus saliphilus]